MISHNFYSTSIVRRAKRLTTLYGKPSDWESDRVQFPDVFLARQIPNSPSCHLARVARAISRDIPPLSQYR